MKNFFKDFFIGLLLGISTWIITYIGVYGLIVYLYINPYNINPYGTYFNPTLFMFNYPLMLSIILTSYLAFFRKAYIIGIGVICGFIITIGMWALLVGLAGGI